MRRTTSGWLQLLQHTLALFSCAFLVFRFLLLWSAVLIMYPTSLAVIALTFSNYVLQPVFPNCIPPYNASRILSMVCLREYFLLAYTKLASVLHKTAQGTAPAGLGIQPRCMGHSCNPKSRRKGPRTDTVPHVGRSVPPHLPARSRSWGAHWMQVSHHLSPSQSYFTFTNTSM